ncbi:hypothetical protein NX773_03710 [Massilia solisilvae]|uniref:Uncharacterized protein n=1 Tax=Massilia solisilvae TaxID=1811225 RepID=A0ABT2BFI1_9BURK|nr:hypothetical protein [Massilia solisilvae]MCS0607273.1 hypothetical protein [Massilia solisilvae]
MKSVALILDPEFGQRVESVAREMPVWVLASRSNDPAIEHARSLFGGHDITSFFPPRTGDRKATSAQALYDIDEHHGELSSSHPYEELLIFGAAPADVSPEAMEELGLEPAGARKDAFVLRKRDGADYTTR